MISFANGALITRPLIACEFLGLNVVHSQTVRWRKPLWLGTAKSKIFRVPVKPVIPKAETIEILRLCNNYRTYRESIRRYFMNITAQNEIQFDEDVVRQADDEDFAACLELNAEWNKEVAKSRQKRESDEFEAVKAIARQRIIDKEKRDAEIMERIEENVRRVKAEAHTFITAENIDQAIDEALANVINYNVAIDSEGNRYEGKYEPVEKERPKKERLYAEQ